jgi:hypothetical protein
MDLSLSVQGAAGPLAAARKRAEPTSHLIEAWLIHVDGDTLLVDMDAER